jgi:hypothetical protein
MKATPSLAGPESIIIAALEPLLFGGLPAYRRAAR